MIVKFYFVPLDPIIDFSIGLFNNLVLNRWESIIWTSDDLVFFVHSCAMRSRWVEEIIFYATLIKYGAAFVSPKLQSEYIGQRMTYIDHSALSRYGVTWFWIKVWCQKRNMFENNIVEMVGKITHILLKYPIIYSTLDWYKQMPSYIIVR